ncbi:ABC transporter permease [Candidatus Thorarchaeota archaeon]|nr:MAG: ABC transporter permease [Candidatus Thorarchaeota archaeon]
MESEPQYPDIQVEVEENKAVGVFSLLQIVFVMLGFMLGGIIFIGNITYTIQGWIGTSVVVPQFISAWVLQSLIIIVLTFLLLKANQGVMERSPDAFGTSFYLYILLTVVYVTMGLIGLVFIVMIIIQFIIMFLPNVKIFWFDEFQEDTKPRIKETRFTLHLVKKSPLVVAGILIITFMVSVALAAPWIAPYQGEDMVFKDSRLPPGSPSNDIRQNYFYILENREFNPDIMPSYYYDELSITQIHLETVEIPRLFVGVSDLNTGNDAVSVNVTFRIYQINKTVYESSTVAERLTYLYASVSVVSQNLLSYIQLPNEEGAYVWELQFIAPEKTSTWIANTRVVLAYYDNYPIHIWGTDFYGGDIYSRIIWGAQKDLIIALSVVIVAVTVGAILGAASGYFGGKFDELMMRITDIFFAFPGLVLAMAIVMAIGVRSLETISIALMVTWWPTYARLVRGQVLSEREKLYIEAARSSGASDTRILFNHILPNTIQPVVVQATMDIGSVLLVAAGLAFIGFGPPVGTAEWGMMIARGQDYILSAPWMTLYPGLAILVTALAFNLVGDGIRDIMDPKLRRR